MPPPPTKYFIMLSWNDLMVHGSRCFEGREIGQVPSCALKCPLYKGCILSIGGWGLIWTLIKMQSFLSRPTLSLQNPAATHFFTSRVLFAFFWFCSTYWVKPSIIFYFNSHSHQIPSFVLCPQRDLPSDAYTMCVSAFPPRCKPTDPKPTSE